MKLIAKNIHYNFNKANYMDMANVLPGTYWAVIFKYCRSMNDYRHTWLDDKFKL